MTAAVTLKNRLTASLPANSLRRRLAAGAFWSLLSATITRALGLVSTVIVARILGKETLGEFGVVQSTIGMMGVMAGVGLGTTATRYIASLRSNDRARVSRILSALLATAIVSGTVMLLIAIAAAPWLASTVLERPMLARAIRIGSLLMILSTLDGIIVSALAGLEAFRLVAQRSVLSSVVSLVATIPLVWWLGLEGAVWSLVASACVSLAFSFTALRAECRIHDIHFAWKPSAIRDECGILLAYSLPALAAAMVVVPVTWAANIILARTPGGYSSMGTVSIINTVRTLVMYLPSVLLAPTFAIMSNSLDRPDVFAKTVRYEIALSSLVVLPTGMAIAVLGHWVIPLVFGSQFHIDAPLIAWAMLVTGVQATGSGLANAVNAMGKMWLGLAVNTLWGFVFLAGAWALIPRYGTSGYFSAMGIAYITLDGVFFTWLKFRMPAVFAGYPLTLTLVLYSGGLVAATWYSRGMRGGPASAIAIISAALMAILLAFAARGRPQFEQTETAPNDA